MSRVSFSLFAGIAVAIAGFGISSPAFAQGTRTVNPFFAIGCPEVVGTGDWEFNGNGPDVDVEFTLRPSSLRTTIFMDTWVDMEETISDFTHGIVNESRTLTTAPAGTHFYAFWDGDQWLPISAGVVIDVWSWFYTDNDRALDNAPTPNVNWLRSVAVMGDTEGDDIGHGEDCSNLPTDSHSEVQTNTIFFAFAP